MVRNLSPMLRQELQNLDKDPDSRKSAMKALKSYVKELDSKTIPQFLAQVSETKDIGSAVGEHTISLYEVLARTHGAKIVPQINNIMTTIIKTLSSSAGSVALHQACAKVVPTIARYGIDPTTPEDKKRSVIHSLCKPLSDCLMGSQESLSAGAALCLKALVESDNWRFASSEMVNEVCLRAAGALEGKCTQTNSHMSLIMALAKQNALIVEAYARLLLNSGLRILQAGVVEGNSQKRLSAIQMVNFLMKSLDPRSVLSELRIIMEEMEKCQSDQMGYVKGAAYECLLTAKGIASRNGSKFEQTGSYGGSNNVRRDSGQRYSTNGGTNYSLDSSFASPESQTLGSFGDIDSFHESPISTSQSSCNNGYTRRSANRKLWRQENGGVDVSLKDGIFSGLAQGSSISDAYSESLGHSKYSDDKRERTDEFAGFVQGHLSKGETKSATASPPRSHSLINVDNVKIYSTPRKLMHSLQDPVDMNSEVFQKQFRKFLSPCSNCAWSPLTAYDQNCQHYSDEEANEQGYTSAESEEFQIGSESVSSTEDVLPSENKIPFSQDVSVGNNAEFQKKTCTKARQLPVYRLVLCLLFTALTVLTSFILIEDQEEGKALVPT
ncbi:unnamed protein product [Rhodiola kirilowii]